MTACEIDTEVLAGHGVCPGCRKLWAESCIVLEQAAAVAAAVALETGHRAAADRRLLILDLLPALCFQLNGNGGPTVMKAGVLGLHIDQISISRNVGTEGSVSTMARNASRLTQANPSHLAGSTAYRRMPAALACNVCAAFKVASLLRRGVPLQ